MSLFVGFYYHSIFEVISSRSNGWGGNIYLSCLRYGSLLLFGIQTVPVIGITVCFRIVETLPEERCDRNGRKVFDVDQTSSELLPGLFSLC